MKLFSVIALAALFQSLNPVSAEHVSVEGDGTFDIKGPICSGPGTVSTPAGAACPQIGDTAVADCFPYHPSYDAKSGKCVAPVPSVCKPVKGGVWGCVWDLSGVAPTPPAKTPVATDCTNVSVEGDGTFCVKGPICSGSGASPAGKACPVVGDAAVADCHPYNPSFDVKSGKCVAPVPAVCKAVKTGVWGCVWDLSGVKPAPAPAPVSAPATASSAPTPAGKTTPAPASAATLEEVKVVDDGVFKVKGPACGGPAANQTGKACPVVGDVAVSGCTPTNPSFDKASGKCVAPVPALCQPTQNNTVWGCVWDLSSLKPASAATALSATTADESSSSDGASAGTVAGTVAGVAAVVAVVAAAIANKRKSAKQAAAASDLAGLEISPRMV